MTPSSVNALNPRRGIQFQVVFECGRHVTSDQATSLPREPQVVITAPPPASNLKLIPISLRE
jgi:hypothetical protein